MAPGVAVLKKFWRNLVRGAPPKPTEDLQEVLLSLHVLPKHFAQMYVTFSKLRQAELGGTVIAASEIQSSSIENLVETRRDWVASIIPHLVEFAGCHDAIDWETFVYLMVKFNSLSKVELCQCLFYVIVKDVKSWTSLYLTVKQLHEFYQNWKGCPVEAFDTKAILTN